MKTLLGHLWFAFVIYVRLAASLFIGAWRGFGEEYDRANAAMLKRWGF